MHERKLKVAIIGAGGWGGHHARIFSQRADVELCAIISRSMAKAAARAATCGARAYDDIGKMIAAERPDLVTVCLPNQAHFKPTLEVIEAGRNLLVEKPLVFDLAEADRLIDEAKKRGLFFAINFNHRYAKPVQMAKRAIDSGELGKINFATWRFGGEGGSDHPYGNLIETQCHGFDMLEYLCGPIESVMAEMMDGTSGGFTTLALALRFASGAVGTLLGSYDSSYAYPGTHLLEVNGTNGRVTVQDTVRGYTFQRTGEETASVWQAGYFNDYDREFQRTFDTHVEAVLQALKAGDPPPVHARAGRRALQLALAAVESFETGKRVKVRKEN